MNGNKTTTTRSKYFTKALLQEAAQNAEKWDFNRQLDLDAINAIPDDARYPVELTLLHHHRHGEPAETHMRAMVAMDADKQGAVAFVDMPLEFFEKLPEATVRVRKATPKRLRRSA